MKAVICDHCNVSFSKMNEVTGRMSIEWGYILSYVEMKPYVQSEEYGEAHLHKDCVIPWMNEQK